MPQQTNLNVAPYFDDFDASKDYHKVLFKPGYPVQARELTTLQSILQNQIEKFGQHFFKEGAKVIPGNIGYSQSYFCIQLQNNFQGVPVEAYVDQLVGTKVTGQTSGVTAYVDKVLLSDDSERGNLTLYINYLNSSTSDNSSQTFFDGEDITCNTTITSGLLGNTSIAAGSPVATTIDTNAAATGSSFQIQDGIYFIRGNFVNVATETLILDQYNNTPSYRIGLYVTEEIVTSDLDESLNDNSQGFNNYSAPGADRLKISTRLFKKSLDDFDDNNFIELATVNNGVIRTQENRGDFGGGPGYLEIRDTLARRTYDESGDYYVKPFDVSLVESLDDKLGNRGIFEEGQTTYTGAVASEDLALYKISPGKAFVRGYEIETLSSTFLNAPKPRTTKTLENQAIIYNTGATIRVNRSYGSPTIGIGNTFVLSLRDSRVGSDQQSFAGNEIGLARVYDYRLESGSYDVANQNINGWDISLYDIQLVSNITLNEPITLPVPTLVKGANSGATAFLKDAVSVGTALTVYDTQGTFVPNESLIFDGINNGRIAIAVTDYSISNVKSIGGTVSAGTTFTADVIQSTGFNIGLATISSFSGGVSTVTSPNQLFPGKIVKKDDLIAYSDTSVTDPIYAQVVSVGATTITIGGVENVLGVANGTLPTSTLEVFDFRILKTELRPSSDTTLYTPLPKQNIASIDLTDAYITIRKSFNVNIASNQLSTTLDAGTDEIFLPFDSERYTLTRSDGTFEELTSDKFAFFNGGQTLQIYGLGGNDTGARLVTTLRKSNPKSKKKIKNRVNYIIVDKSKYEGSGIGATTLNDGLTYGNYPYGTRVQDEVISLNTADVIRIHGVYESADTSDPSAPKMILSSLNSASTTTSEFIIGEQIVGQSSNSIAIVAEKLTDSQISYIYLNQNTFIEGENIVSKESNITGTITTLDAVSFNVSSNYKYGTGQQGTFYNYGTIIRKTDDEPSKKLKIYFESAYYDSSDDGDITTIESYKTFDYKTDIRKISKSVVSDILDIRPRVSNYTVSEGLRSPFEFYGRVFSGSGNSATNILASDESILTTFSYYLGRIDRIFLSKDGKFITKFGEPSDNPQLPISVDDAIEIANINIPPYLFNTSYASVKSLDYKRYRMSDIKKLDDRIRSLEYYTSLSLLETNTANLFVPDSQGLNRFKSGFFVDNFTSFESQEESLPIKNSIDRKNKELRPRHYTNSIDLVFGPVTNTSSTEDLNFSNIEGINVRKQNDIITLDYSEVEWLSQTFATRTESVTPFLISFWNGTLELTPASDAWIDTTRLEPKVILTEGNYSETMANAVEEFNVDPQTGFAPIVWDSWQTNWTGQDIVETTRVRTRLSNTVSNWEGHIPSGSQRWVPFFSRGIGPGIQSGNNITTIVEETLLSGVRTGVMSRNGLRTVVSEQFDETSVGDRVVSRDLVPFMRSRNIQFISKRLKPLTQIFAFFDGKDVTKYCVPKLLEISMTSGTFQVGETIIGRMVRTGLDDTQILSDSPNIRFRVAQSNHKEGPYNIPTVVYPENPYTNQPLSAAYSSTSDILNIDTFSLSNQPQGDFYGWVESGMVITGQSSGAQATIKNVRLVSDLSASLIGSFFIPNPNNINFPRFEAGTKTFTLINSEENDQNVASTIAEEVYTSSGTLETVQENIISVRNARVEQKIEFQERNVSESLGVDVVVGSRVLSQTRSSFAVQWYDPLAQSFLVDEQDGVFLTKCDVFFKTKDDMDIPVVFQLRSMKDGFPTQHILPFSEIVLDPNDVNVSDDGSVATTFEFKAPVYLEGGKEYAIALASNSTKYSVYISRVGENDILSQTFISNQPYLGSLFKSQNASTWEPSQWEDLKFTLYRANFIENGSVEFYNPNLSSGNGQIPALTPDSLVLNSRKIQIGLSTSVVDSGYVNGNTFYQQGSNATGNLVGTAGSVTGSLNISNSGIGYTPNSSGYTFSGVNLVTITGSGKGAVAEVSISNGVAVAATITTGGTGYQIGDVLGITTIGSASVGRNARFSVVSIGNTNQLILDNVQGDFVVGAANTIMYTNSSGISTELNYSNGGNIQVSSLDVLNDGLHIKVYHQNHGMHSQNNLVSISNVSSDIRPTKLSAPFEIGSSGSISVDDATIFTTFENVGVGTTNIGYVLIGDEVIQYTSVDGNNIGGDIVRGTTQRLYPVGTPVYKYEIGGVSLNRINKTHNLSDTTIPNPIGFDYYNIKLDMSSNGEDRSVGTSYPKLYLNQTKPTGGYNINASQNIPYEIITPMVQNVTVTGTTISGEIRTTTGKSLSGNEIPFVDNGFESITLNKANYLDTPRIVASRVNETDKLTNIPGNKSLNMRLLLNTINSYLSPVIDAQRVNAIFTSNRVNDVIEDYINDSRLKVVGNDPTACQYISKEIVLENPASSIKLLLAAHIIESADIRAYYAIGSEPGTEPIFIPFPGWENLNSRGEIINTEESTGHSDTYVNKVTVNGFSGDDVDYREYTFTADQLPSFRTYRVKIILTSTTQVSVPRIRDLRAIALA